MLYRMVALVLDGLVGFPAGLSPTSFHLSPSSFHLSPRLGACGRVPGWLVSHFFSFVSQFFICLPGGVLVVGLPAGLSPTSFHLSPTSFHLSPSSFHLSPTLLVGLDGLVGFPAGLSPTSFHLSPSSFHSPNSLLLGVLNALQNGRLGAGWSGRVPGWLVSNLLSFVSQFFSFASHFFSFVSQTVACGRVPGWLVSHLLSFVSHFFSFVSQCFSFVSQAGCLWSGSWLACLPLPFICLPVFFICLPGWVVVGFQAGLSPTSFHLFPDSFHLSPRLSACGRVPGWLVSHFLSFVSQFFSFVSQAGCLWSGSWLACLPLPFMCPPLFPQTVYC